MDLVEYLGPSTAVLVLLPLDDPADIVRAAAVSREWRRLVITNGLSKNLCLKICPEVSEFARAMEVNASSDSEHIAQVVRSHGSEQEDPEREHWIYSCICNCLVSPLGKSNCILEAVGASSTDYPYESIVNTLESHGRVNARPYYWSSKGEGDPRVPETLTYKLCSNVCVINEIQIQPFAEEIVTLLENISGVYSHIYSAQAVRFRTGYSRSSQQMPNMTQETGNDVVNATCHAADSYVWTYVSPTFTMWQMDSLQSFKLPYPALAIGGLLQIELLGRVQKHEMDNLYYLCVSHVRAIGRPLSPDLDNAMKDCSGRPSLEFLPSVIQKASEQQASQLSRGHSPNSFPDGSGPGSISLVGTIITDEEDLNA